MTGSYRDAPKSDQNELEAVLATLSIDQVRFVIARTTTSSDKEAAQQARIPANTVKQWKYTGAQIDKAVRLMVHDGVTTALHLRRRSLAKAMSIKTGGLESPDEKTRQAAATEIIEWELGKAQQGVDVTSKGEQIGNAGLTDDRQLAAIVALYDRVRARVSAQSIDEGPAMDAASRPAN